MKNDRLEKALECTGTDRVPFVPAIYEHKAWFINDTPSNVSRDVDLLTKAVLTEYEVVQPDALTIGIDVYNVEAEAVGCKVTYYEGDDTSIPAISADSAVFSETTRLTSIDLPDSHRDGRMPVNLEAAKNVKRRIRDEVPVRGALSGPFSMAANLVGPEHLFMLTVTNPGFVAELLSFTSEVAIRFGGAYINEGCEVIIFDSQASPELLSPKMYRDLVLQPTRRMIEHFHALGQKHVPLIIGGNTTKILDSYIETGANNILCDFSNDVSKFLIDCAKNRRAFRRNIDPTDFLVAEPSDLHRRAVTGLEESRGYPGYILGTGVVPYGTPTENLKAIRDAAIEYNLRTTGYFL